MGFTQNNLNVLNRLKTLNELEQIIKELEQSAKLEAEQSALEWYFGSGYNEANYNLIF